MTVTRDLKPMLFRRGSSKIVKICGECRKVKN